MKARLGAAVLIVAVISCSSHDSRAVPSILQVGDAFPVQLAPALPQASCVVAVVTKLSCGVSRPLSVEWLQAVRAAADSGQLTLGTLWFAADDDADARKTNPYPDAGPLLVLPDTIPLLPYVNGVTPTTFILDRSRKVKAIILGNMLPTAKQLTSACSE